MKPYLLIERYINRAEQVITVPSDPQKPVDVKPSDTTLTTSSLYQDALTMATTLLLTDRTYRLGENATIDTFFDSSEPDVIVLDAESSDAAPFASGEPSAPNVETDPSCHQSEPETQHSTASDMSSSEDSKVGSKRRSYYDRQKVGTPRSEKINYVKLVTPSSNTCQTTTSNVSGKQSNKMTYVQYLRECRVKN